MTTTPQKTNRKIWMGAAIGFALLLLIPSPQTASAQTWNGPDGSNNISNANSANVGVGLTVPLYKFDVLSGTNIIARFGSSANDNSQLVINAVSGYNSNLTLQNGGVPKWYFGNRASDNRFSWINAGGSNEVFSILQNGNVGIGTTSPVYKLKIAAGSVVVDNTYGLGSRNAGDTFAYNLIAANSSNQIYLGDNTSSIANEIRFHSTGSSSPSVVINTSGNVGIGTTSPGYKLDVAGEIRSTTGGFRFPDGTVQTTAASGGGSSSQWTGTSTIYYNGGNVGIGTTSPGDLLHLSSSANTNIRLTHSDSASSVNALSFYEGGTLWGIINQRGSTFTSYGELGGQFNIGNANAAGAMSLLAGGANRLQITAGGNVGIGTTSPGELLHIRKDQNGSTSLLLENQTAGTTAQARIQAKNDLGNLAQLGIYSSSSTAYGAVSANNAYAYTQSPAFVLMADNASGVIKFTTGGNSEKVRIDSSGKVGIGTTTPAEKLDVAGNINASGTINAAGGLNINGSPVTASVFGRTGAVVAATNDYTWAQIDKTTSSLANLTTRSAGDLSSGILPDARFPTTLPSASGVNLTALNASSLASGTLPDARFPATLPAASGANLTALNASSLTSGTVATVRLGSGTADASTFLRGDNTWAVPSGGSQWTTSGSDINYAPSGNVGIGTSSPTFKLHVTGNGKFTGNLTVDGNIAAKYQDVAEWVPTSEQIGSGTVVVLDATKSNHVVSSDRAYDTRVAGVISEQPGIALGESGAGKVLVATTGRVKVKVDASRGPIRIGDLLVTSDVPGMAMKSEPIPLGGRLMHMPGTLIGKALEPLEKGRGEILVLLSLQ